MCFISLCSWNSYEERSLDLRKIILVKDSAAKEYLFERNTL